MTPPSRTNDASITFRLPRALRERFQAHAAADGRGGESAVLRELIESTLSNAEAPAPRRRSTRASATPSISARA